MVGTIYQPIYTQSWALIVGINTYQHAGPLGYARQDAEAVYSVLTKQLHFDAERVVMLVDGAATRAAIMNAFLALTRDDVSPDARVLVFYAGHGYTKTGRRGEVGYLVPADGSATELSSLIRWDDLTRNADLIPAKHVLFIMDACYGGLALGRALPPGSKRFLKDMLQRYSRQVLTAGKADEVVADAGGPRPGHSIFTGHFLDALEGAAATEEGVISANAVMAYVYDRVGRDAHSYQSPHFGFLDGDGDLIFEAPLLGKPPKSEVADEDLLVAEPFIRLSAPNENALASLTETVKEGLSDARYRIRLSDLMRAEVRVVREELSSDTFATNVGLTTEAFLARIRAYEAAVGRVQDCVILIAHWGSREHRATLELPLARLAEGIGEIGGLLPWIGLKWYPITLLMYSGGIAALAGENYEALSTVLTTRLRGNRTGSPSQEAALVAANGMLETTRAELFKRVPGHERNYTPASEYIFKTVQPKIEDALFLGTAYEEYFDRFEIIYALVCADIRRRAGRSIWGPIGRFGWKQARDNEQGPFESLVQEAESAGKSWGPIEAGLFEGSMTRFRELVDAFRKEVLANLRWY